MGFLPFPESFHTRFLKAKRLAGEIGPFAGPTGISSAALEGLFAADILR